MEAYLNDAFVALDRASLHVSDLAIQRGYGIFDFFRVKNFVPLYLNDYFDRFYRSAAVMRLEVGLDRDALRAVIMELIRRNNLPDAGIKLILTGGNSPDAYTPVKGNFLISQHPLVLPSPDQVNKGIKIITYPYRRDIPEVKTINYIMGVWLQQNVQDASASDVLYHLDGEVSEFPRCNFFMVTREGVLVTPNKHVLHGITRKNVLRIAAAFVVSKSDPSGLKKLPMQVKFLTSTTKGILPIVNIDGRAVGDGMPGAVTLSLRDRLLELDAQELERAVEISL